MKNKHTTYGVNDAAISVQQIDIKSSHNDDNDISVTIHDFSKKKLKEKQIILDSESAIFLAMSILKVRNESKYKLISL